MSKKTVYGALLAVLLTAIAACSAIEREHGYVPSDADIEKVVIGVDTQRTLIEVIGIPQAQGMLDDGSWYYIKSVVQTYGAYKPKVVDREVLAISFAQNGTVSNIERFGLQDGQVITISRRVTELPIKGPGFLGQVFGNFGNVTASDLVDPN